MDRDLYRTGQSVVLITAGTGVFYVDRHMVLLTKRRLYQYGVGIDLISCTSRPFHTVPLLMLLDNVHDPGKLDGTKEDDEQVFFNIPHWLRICFLSTSVLYGTNLNPCQRTVWLSYCLPRN